MDIADTRPGHAQGVDQHASGAVEADGVGAALDDHHLFDVVGGGLGRKRPVLRQTDADPVELVAVVLAVAPCRGPASRVLGVLDARNQLDQVAVLLSDRQRLDDLVGDVGRDSDDRCGTVSGAAI